MTAKPATFNEPNCVLPSGFLVVIWCLYRRTFLMLAISSDKKPDNKLVYLSQSFSFQCSLLIPLKISENLCFFGVLRGVGGQKGTLERKGLIYWTIIVCDDSLTFYRLVFAMVTHNLANLQLLGAGLFKYEFHFIVH